MGAVRVGLSIPIAGIITIGLFALMTYLIATGESPLQEVAEVETIDFTRVERDESVRTKERELPDKPEQVEQPPPPPPASAQTSAPDAAGLNVAMPNLQADLDLANFDLGAAPEGDVLPLVRVAPQYPGRAMSRGIEGWVQLRFSISQTGTPYNVVVVANEPSGIFDSAAIRAVEKWKYKPRVVNGQPTERHGIEVVISFNLEE